MVITLHAISYGEGLSVGSSDANLAGHAHLPRDISRFFLYPGYSLNPSIRLTHPIGWLRLILSISRPNDRDDRKVLWAGIPCFDGEGLGGMEESTSEVQGVHRGRCRPDVLQEAVDEEEAKRRLQSGELKSVGYRLRT